MEFFRFLGARIDPKMKIEQSAENENGAILPPLPIFNSNNKPSNKNEEESNFKNGRWNQRNRKWGEVAGEGLLIQP